MTSEGSSTTMKILWRITAGVALILLIFTLILVVKVQSAPTANFTGTITDQVTTVYLRNQPSEDSSTNAILNPGTVVEVDRSTTRDGLTWYHIKTESGRGWIPESYLDLNN